MNTGRGFPAVSILTERLFPPPMSSWSNPVQKFTIFCTKHSILFLRNVCLSTIPPQNIEGAERTGMPGIVFHGDADELRREMQAFGVQIP